jgi:3-(3-hydroxy-phenyl)propionate hydroxylase
MHQPQATPRKSVFYNYKIHPFRRPPEMEGRASQAPVVIVGAGPIGMVTALDLARWGVASIVLESELQVSHGSRAIVLTRRSMEIMQQVGVDQPFVAKGLTWKQGRSFFRGQQVYQMQMPYDSDDRFLPALNVQQQFIEEFLVDAIEKSDLIDLRWGSCVTAISQDDAAVTLTVDTPEGPYELRAPWVVAADGGRSAMRRLLGLRMEGRSYEGNFVIADILAPIDLPTERLCYFDPDWNPGNNVLVHRQPDSLWRIDFRLPDGETAEQALEETRLNARIDAVLKMIGKPVEWKLDWCTVYTANTLTLPDYRAGRVLFAGDAAHLLPIFGVRGANTGLQEANNLAWKLAFVISGKSKPDLLDSYSTERVSAAREICDEGGRSTRFMTPPTPGYRLMRDAILSLSCSEHFCRDLLHWRTSRAHVYGDSPLNTPDDPQTASAAGLECGSPIANVRLGDDDFLFDHLRSGFHLVIFAGEADRDDVERLLQAARASPVPVITILVALSAFSSKPAVDLYFEGERARRIAAKWQAGGAAVYLVRPDLHVAARWHGIAPERLAPSLSRAACSVQPVTGGAR